MSQPPPSSQRRLAPAPPGSRLTARPLNRQMSTALPPSYGSQGAPMARPPKPPYNPTPPQSSQSPFEEESEYYEEENSPYQPYHPPQPPHTTPFRPASASSARPRPPRAEPPQANFSTPRRPASAQPPNSAFSPSSPVTNVSHVAAATAATSAAEKPVNVLLRKVNNVESRLDGLEKQVTGVRDMVHDVRTHTEVTPSRDELKEDMKDYVGNALHEFKGQILTNVDASLANLLRQVSDQVTINVVDKVSPLLANQAPAPPRTDDHASRLMAFLIDALAPVSELNKKLGTDLPELAQQLKAVASHVQALDVKFGNLPKPSAIPLATESGQQKLLKSLAGISERVSKLEGAFEAPLAALQNSVESSLTDSHESLAALIRRERDDREQAEKQRLARRVQSQEAGVQAVSDDSLPSQDRWKSMQSLAQEVNTLREELAPVIARHQSATSAAPGPAIAAANAATSLAGPATQTPQRGPLPTPPTTAPTQSTPVPSSPPTRQSSALSPAPPARGASPALSTPAAVAAVPRAPPKKRAAKRKSTPAPKRRRTTKTPGPSSAAPAASDVRIELDEPQARTTGQASPPTASSANDNERDLPVPEPRSSTARPSGARTVAASARTGSAAASVPRASPHPFPRRSNRNRRTPARYPEISTPKHEAIDPMEWPDEPQEPREPSEPPEPPKVPEVEPPQSPEPPEPPEVEPPQSPQSPEPSPVPPHNSVSQPGVSLNDTHQEASQDNSSGVPEAPTPAHAGGMRRRGGLTPKESSAVETLATMSGRSEIILYDSQDSLRSHEQSMVKCSPATTPIPRPNSYIWTPASPPANSSAGAIEDPPAPYNSFNGGTKTPIPKRPRSATPGPALSTFLDAPHLRNSISSSQSSTQRRSLGSLNSGGTSPVPSFGGKGWQQSVNAAAGPSRLGSASSQAGEGNAPQRSSSSYWQSKPATAPSTRPTSGFTAYQIGPARLAALTSQARQERADDSNLLDEDDFYPNLKDEMDGDKLLGLEEF